MAGYNEIQVGRYNRMLQKLLSMKGPASMNELSSTLQLALSVFHGVENRYLEGWDRFGNSINTTAVAANFGAVRFRNPSGSNVIAVFEKIQVFGVLTDQPFLEIGATALDLATASAGVSLDPRGRNASTLIVSFSGTSVALTNKIGQTAFVANGSYDFIVDEDQEIAVLPGQALQLHSNIANQVLNQGSFWRERFLEDSERT